PDLSGGGVGGFCVPNAQHAVRQAKVLAKNLTAVLRGEGTKNYFHKNLGAVAGLGLYNGVFQSGKIALKGFIAWVWHRGYPGLAMRPWERTWRVLWGCWNNLWLGRDFANLAAVPHPRSAFEEFAARPRPAVAEAAAPAAQKNAAKSDAGKPAPVNDAGESAEKKPAAKADAAKPAAKKPAAKKPAAKKPESVETT